MQVYISLGSNLGNRMLNLRRAALKLQNVLQNLKQSIVLETKAILLENTPQEWNKPYLNMIVSGQTKLSPHDLLVKLQAIEIELGRSQESQRWSPRIIDLDILLYDDENIHSENLVIPHRELKNRLFFQHLLACMGHSEYEMHVHSFVRSFVLNPAFVGILNVTSDSFSDGGKFSNVEAAVQQALHLYESGATFIDIGAQSTRPNAILQSAEQEIAILKPILSALSQHNIPLSIDSFRDEVLRWALNEYKIDLINDVSGDFHYDQEIQQQKKYKVCIMHSLTVPANPNVTLPKNVNVIQELIEWAKRKIDQLLRLGFSSDDIIIDPGIGFGKTHKQNIDILRKMNQFRELGVQILIGHSRKSYISAFTHSIACDRDIETIAVSNIIARHIDFLRVHDVSNHMKFFATQQTIENEF